MKDVYVQVGNKSRSWYHIGRSVAQPSETYIEASGIDFDSVDAVVERSYRGKTVWLIMVREPARRRPVNAQRQAKPTATSGQ